MKKIFWTSIFWIAVVAGFLSYLKWFDTTNLGVELASYVVTFPTSTGSANTGEIVAVETTGAVTNISGSVLSGSVIATGISSSIPTVQTTPTLTLDQKFDTIQQQLKDISEKLDTQNSNTPDAVNISLKTTKKTNVRVYPLDGSTYKKYLLNPSDDILADAMNLLFEKSAFTVVDTRLDGDGNLTIQLARVPGSAFGGSAAVAQVKTSIEKTALQFPQIKKVIITPDTILQP
jgi:hypothetical protein